MFSIAGNQHNKKYCDQHKRIVKNKQNERWRSSKLSSHQERHVRVVNMTEGNNVHIMVVLRLSTVDIGSKQILDTTEKLEKSSKDHVIQILNIHLLKN